VLIGFIGTAWFAVLMVICYYHLAFDPTRSPYWSPQASACLQLNSADDAHEFMPNYIDELAIKWSSSMGRFLFSRFLDKPLYERFAQRARW